MNVNTHLTSTEKTGKAENSEVFKQSPSLVKAFSTNPNRSRSFNDKGGYACYFLFKLYVTSLGAHVWLDSNFNQSSFLFARLMFSVYVCVRARAPACVCVSVCVCLYASVLMLMIDSSLEYSCCVWDPHYQIYR